MNSKLVKTVFVCLSFAILTQSELDAQWIGTSPIYTNSNVGIGITPSYKLHILATEHSNYSPTAFPISDFILDAGAAQGSYTSLSLISRSPYNNDASGITIANIPTGNGNSEIAFGTRSNYVYSEKLRITKDGSVGIGIINPSEKLEVKDGSVFIHGSAGGQGRLVMQKDGHNMFEWYPGDNGLGLYDRTSSAYRMTILNNGNVGIGTTIPSNLLTLENTSSPTIEFKTSGIQDLLISGSSSATVINSLRTNPINFQINSSNVFTIAGNGNVGIGTNSPETTSQLHIKSLSQSAKITIETTDSYESLINFSGATSEFSVGFVKTDNSFRFNAANDLANNERMRISAYGNLLIGKTTQNNNTYKLDVAGKGRFDEVVVNTSGADFVFAPAYKLRPLAEVEQYVNEHQHLPEIAPAAEMEANGVNVSEMQTKMLQKIEELTLYTIELNKKVEALQAKNIELEGMVKGK